MLKKTARFVQRGVPYLKGVLTLIQGIFGVFLVLFSQGKGCDTKVYVFPMSSDNLYDKSNQSSSPEGQPGFTKKVILTFFINYAELS